MDEVERTPLDDAENAHLSILLVGTQMALGGAQRLLLDQARWLHGRGHRVTTAFFYDKQGLAEIWSRGLSFPLITLSGIGSSINPIRRAIGLMAGLFRLWLLIQRGRFDVVETFTYDSNLLALPMAWLSAVPARIATHHGIIEGFPRLAERLHTTLINAGIASILVNVSRKVLEQAAAVGIRRERMTVIPNGILSSDADPGHRAATRAELGVGENDVLVVSVGRLVYQKGHEYLIEAMQDVIRELPGTRAVVFGEGPLRGQLEDQIERFRLRGTVRLGGNRMDVDRFLRAADVFVLPSRWEGMPVALLEAMDAALPVVATRVEGVEEVILDGQQGLLVPPEDARSLALALRSLVVDADLRLRMGKAARQRMREAFTIDTMCDRYISLMRKLLQRRRTPHRSA